MAIRVHTNFMQGKPGRFMLFEILPNGSIDAVPLGPLHPVPGFKGVDDNRPPIIIASEWQKVANYNERTVSHLLAKLGFGQPAETPTSGVDWDNRRHSPCCNRCEFGKCNYVWSKEKGQNA